jgi:hypothetical protein
MWLLVGATLCINWERGCCLCGYLLERHSVSTGRGGAVYVDTCWSDTLYKLGEGVLFIWLLVRATLCINCEMA